MSLFSMFTTTLAVILIIVSASMDYKKCSPHMEMPNFNIVNYFLALGTLIFSYGGHAAFPTIQVLHLLAISTAAAFVHIIIRQYKIYACML